MYRLAIFLLFSLLFFSCKEPVDDTPPSVQITSPSGFSQQNFDDFLNVAFSAQDASGLSNWTIRCTAPDGSVWFDIGNQSISETPASTDLTYAVPLDEIHAPSGVYSLGVFVQDTEGNQGASFAEFQYYGAPLLLERILVISQPSASQTRIDSLGATGLEFAGNFTGNVRETYAASYHQTLILAGETSPTVRFVSSPLLDNISEFTLQNPLGDVLVRDIAHDIDHQTYWMTCLDERIREFRPSGQVRSSINLLPNQQSEELAVVDNRLVAEVRFNGNSNRSLAYYETVGGNSINSQSFEGDLISLLPNQTGDILGFGNQNNAPILLVIDPAAESFYTSNQLVSDFPLSCAASLGDGRFAVGHQDGVYIYNLQNSGIVFGGANGINALSVAYDSLGGVLYAIDDQYLYAINAAQGTILNQWDAPVNPVSVEILYNK